MVEAVYDIPGRRRLSFGGFADLMLSNGYKLVERRRDFQEFRDGETNVKYKSHNGLGRFSSVTITINGDRGVIAQLERLMGISSAKQNLPN